MKKQASRLNVNAILSGLKDFQQNTVEYVFRRLYLDQSKTRRFLIADEAGLGKTFVARGVIARAIDYLWDTVERIDIVYICSNADIARQNINRLNVTGQEDFALASRITLLPTQLSDLENNRLNFVSFTPGTSFDLKSNLGKAEERALLYWLLDRAWGISGTGPRNALQGYMSTENFREWVRYYKSLKIDESLSKAFEENLHKRIESDKHEGRLDIRSRFEGLSKRFGYARKYIPDNDSQDRLELVGELRTLLAATCLRALEPDLIILDEFQRFKHLLDGEDEASRLARELFNYSNEKASARVILLSATPYKMYTLTQESADEDHYQDFLRTFRFLEPDVKEAAQFEQLLSDYRHELYRLGNGGGGRLPNIKQELELRLRRVMVRTERLSVTEDRDGMLMEVPCKNTKLETGDLESYIALERVARLLEQENTIEYWKSAPYLLNFMDNYKLKSEFEKGIRSQEICSKLFKEIGVGKDLLLSWKDIFNYSKVDPNNARLRGLLADTVDLGVWRLLWIPPSLSYYQLGSPFSEPALKQFTKRLVFSSWKVVPKVIASLVSYDAERRMICSFEENPENTIDARKRRRPLLRFALSDDRPTGMPVLGLIYPCVTLAHEFDPLTSILNENQKSEIPAIGYLLDRFSKRIEEMLIGIKINQSESGSIDESWYWAAPILLDLLSNSKETIEWLERPNLAAIWSGKEDKGEKEEFETHWSSHLKQALDLAHKYMAGKLSLGRRPPDLALVLGQMALGGFGITALRALSRMTGGPSKLLFQEVRDSAAQIARSFLYLFNLPEVMALLRGMNREEPYWRRVLEYCVNGGLQATLDEYTHVLRESLGLIDKVPAETASELSKVICDALTLRTSNLGVDDIDIDPLTCQVKCEGRGIRARFALRFGEEKVEDSQEMTRADQVRTAFNSPFWPFVLATTSVGQEGLDFHTYCHAIVHWNLPSNPVDLEQREGRIHRYKGHAVRKNLSTKYGAITPFSSEVNPWEVLFNVGKINRNTEASDLVPFWVFPLENGAKIERHVPALPLSRELERFAALRRSLVVYRMVFGQTRQEDLLAYLLAHLPESDIPKVARELRIDLSPPNISSGEGNK